MKMGIKIVLANGSNRRKVTEDFAFLQRTLLFFSRQRKHTAQVEEEHWNVSFHPRYWYPAKTDTKSNTWPKYS